ncbi:hypothetical protein A0E43_18870 [Pectobacterium cacticida]
MVDQPRLLACGIDPDALDLQHPQVVAARPAVIHKPTFQVGPTFAHQRRIHRLRRYRGEAKVTELVQCIARAVADVHHCLGQIHRRHRQHALACFRQCLMAVVPRPDDRTDQGRLVLHHHVKAHCHQVGPAVHSTRGHQDDGAGLEDTIGLFGGQLIAHGVIS